MLSDNLFEAFYFINLLHSHNYQTEEIADIPNPLSLDLSQPHEQT